MRQTLFFKISLSVGLVVTVSLSVFSFFLFENQKEHLLLSKNREIETLSGLISQGVANFMKDKEQKDFHNFINLFATSNHLLEIRILDEAGTILHSSRNMEKDASMPYLFPRGTPAAQPPIIWEQEIGGRPFLSSLRTFSNEPSCHSCHGDQKKALGLLHVSIPMEATRQSLRFNRHLLIASTAVTLLVMALAINLLLTRLVKRPTRRLMETMAQVEKGNLEVQVKLGTRDELGQLAENFSSMVQKLSAAQKEVERQHREQMAQVQHLASLGELAASVAHEIRNPLAGIKLAIQILSRAPEMAADHRETMAEIMSSIERLEKTMADLLLYSRVQPPELQTCSLPEVIGQALSSLKEELHLAGIQVEKIFDPVLPHLRLDSGQMLRVFLNLSLNALQAMPRGGTLTIQTRYCASLSSCPENLIPLQRSGLEKAWAEILIADTGEGMPSGILREAFRPFFTTKAKGTGLGLSLSRRIIEQHGGQIFARSEPGKGATFCLLLPIPSDESLLPISSCPPRQASKGLES